MANAAADMDKKPMWSGRGRRMTACVHVDIGAVGAPTISAAKNDDSGITITRSNVGIYALVYPKCVDARILVELVSAAGTVKGSYLTAKSATAGTATIVLENGAGVTTEAANGDVMNIVLTLDTENV